MAFKMKGFRGFHDLFKKQSGPKATKKLTDFEKMSYAEQEKYMNEKHHSIVPTMSDFIHSARHKNKNKKNKKR